MNSKFLGFIESANFKKYLQKSKCNFCDCPNKPIESHSYPKSFLKKISDDKKIYCINMREVVTSVVNKNVEDFITECHINKSGVLPLFCQFHDGRVFSRIENINQNIDIETYIFLYSYRFFIYDYCVENYVKNTEHIEQNLDKNLITQVENYELQSYINSMNESSKILNNDYNIKNLELLREKFNNIFSETEEPISSHFKKFFTLKYYELNITNDFFASGIMYYKLNNSDDEIEPLVSIFSLIPDFVNDRCYFSIVIPKEENENISPLIKSLDDEYDKYNNNKENCFLDCVVFNLLDASQNIFLTKDFYSRIDINELKYIYNFLILARRNKLCSKHYRDIAFQKIHSLNILLERQ